MEAKHLNPKLISKLGAISNSFVESEYIRTNELVETAKSIHRFINRYYKTILPYEKTKGFDRLFSDSFYKLEQTSMSLIKSFKNVYLPTSNKKNDIDLLLFFKTATMDNDLKITDESLDELVNIYEQRNYMKSVEFDFIKHIISLSALIKIKQLIKAGNEDFDSFHHAVGVIYSAEQLDISCLIQKKNRLEMLFNSEPAAIYQLQNEKTKNYYRYMISKMSRLSKQDELTLAREIIARSNEGEKSKHIGFMLYSEYEKYSNRNTRKSLHLKSLYVVSVLFALLISFLSKNLYILILIIFPIIEIVRPMIEFLLLKGVEIDIPPRLDFKNKIPKEHKTLVVISTLVPEISELSSFKSKIENLVISNNNGEIFYVVLADLKQAQTQTLSKDKETLGGTDKVVKELNRLYDNKVLMVVRNREYSQTQKAFIGRERKRGAISDLAEIVMGKVTHQEHICGDINILKGAKYMLTLDYDTGVLFDSIVDFVELAAHPVNAPVLDKEKGIIKSGYGIICPKMTLDLKETFKTPFIRLVGGVGGTSYYETGCADFYQDIYQNSIFSGKGLINIEAFYSVMEKGFQPETVLSHDIIEGLFLRVLFARDIEVIDGFPSNATGFFKRFHRWIRGDFQNIPFLFKNLFVDNERYKNPLSKIDKYKIFDNLRRELTPVFSLACILFASFSGKRLSITLFFIAILSVIAPYLFSIFINVIKGSITAFTTRTYSKTLSIISELLVKSIVYLMLLPQLVFVTLDASIRAIYRRFVSKKNMLEWMTAAQVQGQASEISNEIKYYFPCIVSSIILALSPHLFFKIFGIIFTFSLLFVHITGKQVKEIKLAISKEKRDVLTSDVRQMLMFYNNYCNQENNFLPPDNVQEAPVFRIAHRTSPTNIGLMLLSILTARDLDFITTDMLFTSISKTINTVEKLEKFNGNLFNWYDTKTTRVLEPAFVSTVDSGNLVCSLVCLKEGLKEYQNEHNEMQELINRIEVIIDQTDLSCLYDKKKMLFTIGYDRQCDSYCNSHYDMLMSEARMTSYFAVAKGIVEKKHWGTLSRTLSRQGCCNTGPMSWTGTMFEYFMPELLLKCYRGSLGYEGLKYCIHCQKNRVKKLDIPYGISECGIYQFDSQLNYQYKANGVQRVALKRGMNEDLCIAPYATYLTLSLDFESAYDNLQRLNEMKLKGRYGFYEAVDYTRKRVGDSNLQVIKSFMAHHIGMSVVAVNNAINQNIMQKRFLRDMDMRKATELLQEKMQVGEVVFFDQIKREKAVEEQKKLEEFQGQLNPRNPKVKVINNGEISSIICDSGVSFIKRGNTDITRRTTDLLRNPIGTFCFISYDGIQKSLTYAPTYDDYNLYETSFDRHCARFYADFDQIKSEIEVSQHRILPCEQRIISLKNISQKPIDATMLIYVEPSLFGFMDDATHKAFSKLFVNITYDYENKIIVATRKKRGTEEIIYMAVGFREDIDFEVESNRENVFDRGNVQSVSRDIFTKKIIETTGVPDPCIAIRFLFDMQKNECKEFTMITAISKNKSDAINHIISLRKEDQIDECTACKSNLEYGSLSHRISGMLLPQILFQKRDTNIKEQAIRDNVLGIPALWSLGISGDYPIVLVEVLTENDTERVKEYAKCFSQLRLCGIEFDLVYIYSSNNSKCATKKIIKDLVMKLCGNDVINKRGGVYIFEKDKLEKPHLNLLHAIASHNATRNLFRIETQTMPYSPIEIKDVDRGIISERIQKDKFDIIGGFFSGDSFFIKQTPSLPWCHILSNPTFGTLVSDKALGFTWAINSRENKLTPWYNDTRRDNNGEMLVLRADENYYNLISGSTPEFNKNYATFHGKINKIQTKTTVTIPKRGMIKYIKVELKNNSKYEKNIELSYYTEPVLGVARDKSNLIKGEFVDNSLLFHNPFAMSGRAFMGITAFGEKVDFICDRQGYFNGIWDSNTPPPMQDLCGAISVKKKLKPNETKVIEFALCFSTTKKGVSELLRIKPTEIFAFENQLSVKTGDRTVDELVNTWLPHQIVSSRIFGRTGFYQCGGAYGFRDQLQDVSALTTILPSVARTHIIRCCASQFEDGDVMHWWHTMPSSGWGKKGVRTRYSDDLIWLPYVVSDYVKATGDKTILDVKVKYLIAHQIPKGQKDIYIQANYTEYTETVYEHCKRAIDKAYNLGKHGLPKIGSGDWNDGYSNVGIGGIGESVWLAQFLSLVMKDFSSLSFEKGETELSSDYITKSKSLLHCVDEHCYEKDHYVRAFFDDGDVMGSNKSEECKIDSLTQSFSALSDMPDTDRTETALRTAYDSLVDKEKGIIKLFTPAFDTSEQNPGYVKAYPRGVRENGGQYTHAAVWQAMAMHKTGAYDEFFEFVNILNPIKKYLNKEASQAYKTEPYYMTADIYTNEYNYGRSGWSIYTGSSGWYYQLLVKNLLGINQYDDKIEVKPTLPKSIKSFDLYLKLRGQDFKKTILVDDKAYGFTIKN